MRYPVLTIRRADLVASGACADWLAVFDFCIAERDLERVPLEPHADGTPRCGVRRVERGPVVRRRDGSTYRDAARLRIELSPLAQVWLSLPLPVTPGSGTAWAWLRACGIVGGANLYGANLSGANLSGADLYGANLSGANLYGAHRRTDERGITGWTVREGRLWAVE